MFYARRGSNARSKAAQEFAWPGPVRGLLRAGVMAGANPLSAHVLENFIPTAQGARLRGGVLLYATVGAAVDSLFTYQAGSAEKMFAATASAVTDISAPADPDTVATATIDKLTSGDWSHVQFATSGGQWVVAVNGSDPMFYYNGSAFEAVNAAATNNVVYDGLTLPFSIGQTITGGTSGATATIVASMPTSATAGRFKVGAITGGPFQDNEAITSATGAATVNGASSSASSVAVTGVSTNLLSFVWSHKRRLWFVEKNTLSAWYLPVDSIGGTAAEFPLDGVFPGGGSLLFGGTWSSDPGDGMDDLQVFATTEGEIAVYQGTDPSSATTWALVGVFKIGKPLSKTSWFKTGGDLVILTEDGIVPVSEALRKDRASLQVGALTAPIEDLWQEAVAQRDVAFRFSAAFWPTRTLLLVGTPDIAGNNRAMIANTRTGAWATVKGWDVRASVVFGDALYIGTPGGQIGLADAGGQDFGNAYTGVYVPTFQEFGTTGEKHALHCRAVWRSAGAADVRVTAFANYDVGHYPAAGIIVPEGVSTWGSFVWGEGIWGAAGVLTTKSRWTAVAAQGLSLAPALVIASSMTDTPAFEIVTVALRYETGESI